MNFIITDRPLEKMMGDDLPPICDLRDWFSQSIGEDLPPIMDGDLEGWLSKLPLRPDGKQWALPAWGIPPCCRPIYRLGAVELVNYTNGKFIESLRAATRTDSEWYCYVDPHDSGCGGSRLRPFVGGLFVYWYLSRCDGIIGMYSDELGFVEKDTPVAMIDVSERRKGECPIRHKSHPGTLYLFHSFGQLGQDRDTARILTRLAKDEYSEGWYRVADGLTVSDLIGLFENAVYDVIMYPSSCFSDKWMLHNDPIEVLFLNG